jgi:Tfp pilus assembly protein PilV
MSTDMNMKKDTFVRSVGRRRAVRGLILIEVLLAVALLAAVASSILLFLTSQLVNLKSVKEQTRMVTLAEESMEAVRAIRDADWDAFTLGSHGLAFTDGLWSFSGASDTTEGFARTVTVDTVSDTERKVSIRVASLDEPEETAFELTSVLSNWRNLEPEGDDPWGDWGNPQFVGDPLDFGPGFRGIAVDIVSHYLYLAGHGSVSTANELYILDVSDPANPSILGSINTGSGINEVAANASETYAFVANADGRNQLQIVDISNKESLSLVYEGQIPGNRSKGRSLDLNGDMLYFGTEGPDSAELYVIDVSDVQHPDILSSVKVGNDINDTMAHDGIAYLASDVDDRELTVVDATDPEHAVVAAYVDLPGNADGEGLYINGDQDVVYVARKQSGAAEVIAVDVSDPYHPQMHGELEYANGVESLYAAGTYLFVIAQGDEEFMVYDASNLPYMTYMAGLDIDGNAAPTDITYKDNVFYVVLFDRDALRVITAY